MRSFLQSERSSLATSPILLISSGAAGSLSLDVVDHACQKAQFILGMELGLRTVSSTVASAFPTLQQVENGMTLAKRTGATTILGVGSGAAMDLSKALVDKHNARGILVPATYGAILASTSSHALLLDTNEEALVIQQRQGQDSSKQETTVVIETDALANVHERDAAWACLSIGMDALYTNPDFESSIQVIQHSLRALEDSTYLPEALASAGAALSFGSDDSVRSAPLALAASLIPPCFPHVSMLTLMASLAPGILKVSNIDTQLPTKSIPSLALLAMDSAEISIPTLMSHVRSNQALWNCKDVEDHVLEEILKYSLNR